MQAEDLDHVVARLATRHDIAVSLNATPGSGITAVVILPAHLFTTADTGEAVPLARLLPASDGVRTGGRVSDALPPTERERETVPSPADAEPGRRSVPGLGVIRNGDAWLPPEPFAAMPGPDAGPAGPVPPDGPRRAHPRRRVLRRVLIGVAAVLVVALVGAGAYAWILVPRRRSCATPRGPKTSI